MACPKVLTFPSAPQSLVEKYRPRVLSEFCGIPKPKEILQRFAENPRASNWLFCGDPGTGKTTSALALAQAIGAEVQHIASNDLTVARINDVHDRCYHVPMFGQFWLVLIDEVDTGSKQALDSLLSKLDSTEKAPNTIYVLTCNEIANLPPRLIQRCLKLDYSTYGIQKDAVELLEKVWAIEAPGKVAPNLPRIVKENNGSVRAALMALELELMLA